MVVNDSGYHFGRYLYVCHLVLTRNFDFYNGLILADADAACLGDGNIVGETALRDLLYKRVENRSCACYL